MLQCSRPSRCSLRRRRKCRPEQQRKPTLIRRSNSLINYRLPPDYWAHYARNVRALTEPQLAAAAKKFVRPDEVIWIIVGDLKKVEQGIRELGYGDIIRLDSNGEPMK